MKLNIVPARTGLTWVKLGCQAFFRQPLAMSGLFFLYMAAASLLSLIPLAGPVIALMVVPAATLGFMVATQQAIEGKFPMPTVLVSAFRAGRERASAMLVLGAIYATACLLIALVIVPALVGTPPVPPPTATGAEAMMNPQMQITLGVTMLLYLPVSLLFWYAPGLVHWHGISPVKSLFFSFIACVRNIGALLLFGLGWFLIIVGASFVIPLIGALAGPNVAGAILLPLGLLFAAMVSTSIYFPFCDSFVATPGDSPDGETNTTTPPGDHA